MYFWWSSAFLWFDLIVRIMIAGAAGQIQKWSQRNSSIIHEMKSLFIAYTFSCSQIIMYCTKTNAKNRLRQRSNMLFLYIIILLLHIIQRNDDNQCSGSGVAIQTKKLNDLVTNNARELQVYTRLSYLFSLFICIAIWKCDFIIFLLYPFSH